MYIEENDILESGVSQKICVNKKNLQEDQNYIFNPTKKKQLRGKFATAVGAEHLIHSVQLINMGKIPRIIQNGEKIETLSKHGAYCFNKN